LRHPVSALALGDFGWVQTVVLRVTGLLALAFALGTPRAARPGISAAVLIAVWGLGIFVAGIFPTDPVSGYPPGTPAITNPPTAHS
jgi:hypothetical protein